MSIKKQFLKSRPVCKVKFTLPKEQAVGAEQAFLVGEFNDWDSEAIAMKRLKTGAFTATLELPKDSEYQFRYRLDNDQWINDEMADYTVPSNIGQEHNGVITL